MSWNVHSTIFPETCPPHLYIHTPHSNGLPVVSTRLVRHHRYQICNLRHSYPQFPKTMMGTITGKRGDVRFVAELICCRKRVLEKRHSDTQNTFRFLVMIFMLSPTTCPSLTGLRGPPKRRTVYQYHRNYIFRGRLRGLHVLGIVQLFPNSRKFFPQWANHKSRRNFQ